MLDIKPFQETLNMNMCAPATLKMLLTFFNLPGQEKSDLELSESLKVDSKLGVTNESFIKICKDFGLKCEPKINANLEDIEKALQKEHPVVVDWFSPGRTDRGLGEMPDGHYSIVVDLDDKYIYLQDPEVGELRKITRENFYRVWFDFDEPGKDFIENTSSVYLRYMIEVSER